MVRPRLKTLSFSVAAAALLVPVGAAMSAISNPPGVPAGCHQEVYEPNIHVGIEFTARCDVTRTVRVIRHHRRVVVTHVTKTQTRTVTGATVTVTGATTTHTVTVTAPTPTTTVTETVTTTVTS